MAKNIKTTMQGQKINFDLFVALNDRTKALGNMNVNARGDVVTPRGDIIKTRNEVMKQKFTNQTVTHKSRAKKSKKPPHGNFQPGQGTISNTNIQTRIVKQPDSTLNQLEGYHQFGPRTGSNLRGVLASNIEIDVAEVTKPSHRSIKRI